MMYLISQLWVWLLLALVLGLVFGWLTCNCRSGSTCCSRCMKWAAGAFLIGLLVAVLRLLPDRLGFMLDSALLMLASYVIGYIIACLLRRRCCGEAEAPAAQPAPVARPVAVAAAPAPVKPAPAPAPAAAAPAPAPVAPAPQQPAVDVPAGTPGRRPLGLMAPRGGQADDLKRIRGIGRQNEGRLHALGIWHFDQIASWVSEEIDWVGSYLAFPGRIEREDWVGQAKLLARGLETEFSKRVARGEVATSSDAGNKGSDNVADLSKITNATPKPKS